MDHEIPHLQGNEQRVTSGPREGPEQREGVGPQCQGQEIQSSQVRRPGPRIR